MGANYPISHRVLSLLLPSLPYSFHSLLSRAIHLTFTLNFRTCDHLLSFHLLGLLTSRSNFHSSKSNYGSGESCKLPKHSSSASTAVIAFVNYFQSIKSAKYHEFSALHWLIGEVVILTLCLHFFTSYLKSFVEVAKIGMINKKAGIQRVK